MPHYKVKTTVTIDSPEYIIEADCEETAKAEAEFKTKRWMASRIEYILFFNGWTPAIEQDAIETILPEEDVIETILPEEDEEQERRIQNDFPVTFTKVS
jgi:hypothetical protein